MISYATIEVAKLTPDFFTDVFQAEHVDFVCTGGFEVIIAQDADALNRTLTLPPSISIVNVMFVSNYTLENASIVRMLDNPLLKEPNRNKLVLTAVDNRFCEEFFQVKRT